MSSIAKTSISLSKKDLTKSRLTPVGYRNVVFYHKATAAQIIINLAALTLPSAEMPTVVQATPEELASARLTTNKKNLKLTSSIKGDLIQGLDYIVVDSTTILLIGPYETIGAEVDEIFVGVVTQAPVSDLVVASSKSVVRSYTLPVGQNALNLAHEFKVNEFSSENIGIIKLFVNGVLALRNTGNSAITLDKDYYEVDSGSGFGSTVYFNVAPIGTAHEIVVDFGVQAITDFNAIGTIESLSGSVKKLADDVAVMAGTSAGDYINANPSEVERRAFGDMVLDHETRVDAAEVAVALLNSKYDTTENLSEYTKTKWQRKFISSTVTTNTTISSITFNNLEIGKSYRISGKIIFFKITGASTNYVKLFIYNGATALDRITFDSDTSVQAAYCASPDVLFTATDTVLTFQTQDFSTGDQIEGSGTINASWVQLEELPNHEVTTQWT